METPCIEHQGFRNKYGYGQAKWMTPHGLIQMAHRLAWYEAFGPIPEGMCVLHGCDNPPCINVDHLFLGTRVDNNADKMAKGRQSSTKGEANGAAKLTEANVLDIRTQYAAGGVFQRELASRYGVKRPAIGKVLSGRTWSHVQ